MATQWLIDDWLPMGHKGQITAPEGTFKTMWMSYCSVCTASGTPILGHKIPRGAVIIEDEETPEPSLDTHLDRFSQGLGYNTWQDLPIKKLSMSGFRFGRKTELDKLLKLIVDVKPRLITLDSLLAMLPSGRQGIAENDSSLGTTVRDDLNRMLKAYPYSATLLAAHSKKFVSELRLGDLKKYDMQSLVRGHGSIVGEGCDTGFIIKKISEHPEPTRFAIITKSRRQAIPMSAKIVYVELEEQSYGKGWARLKEISPTILPPSSLAKELFLLFVDKEDHDAREIVNTYAFYKRTECHVGILELLDHKVITNRSKPQTYFLNPHCRQQCDPVYLAALRKK